MMRKRQRKKNAKKKRWSASYEMLTAVRASARQMAEFYIHSTPTRFADDAHRWARAENQTHQRNRQMAEKDHDEITS